MRDLLHYYGDVIGVKVVTHTQEQLDALVADVTESADVIENAVVIFCVVGVASMNGHVPMPVATTSGGKQQNR